MSKVEVDEHLLVQIWKRQLVEVGKLVTDTGERVQVVYPGKENKDRGPDFVGAVIATAGRGVLTGDIELHSRASDWKSHGHHRDPNYNEVILHVVWEGGEAAKLQKGKTVPTLSLCHCLKGSVDDVRYWADLPIVPSEPCCNARQWLGDSEMGRVLDEAGEERFRLKADYFAFRMGEEPPSQVLYRGIMGALGYTKNKDSFEELACRLPLAVLEDLCRGKRSQEQVLVLKALLLGKAGLLPGGGSGGLGRIWDCLGDGETMSSSCWHVFRVRPGNHPARRLVGAAHLLARFMEMGLFEGVLQLVSETSLGMMGHLESDFVVSTPDPCFNSEHNLIGQGRAREIVINIILPFAFAWAKANLQGNLVEQVSALYRSYPKAGENGVTRELAELLLGTGASELVDSAQRQQGLIHLDKTFCRQRECPSCPVARRLASEPLAG
ncbi:MAG: DUF2851 family protein [Dehalococcoidia bacterium]|nr:MAG: DUF2851 family protein [Dehalococcoidia bacterium]